jgi:hypothetical protein
MSRVNVSIPGVVRLALAKLDAIVADERPVLLVHFEAVDRRAPRGGVRLALMKMDGAILQLQP